MTIYPAHGKPSINTGCIQYIYTGSLPAQVSPALGLQMDDDLSQLDVPLLLQLCQDSGSEEHLRVANTVGGRVQVKCFHLGREGEGEGGRGREGEGGGGRGREGNQFLYRKPLKLYSIVCFTKIITYVSSRSMLDQGQEYCLFAKLN